MSNEKITQIGWHTVIETTEGQEVAHAIPRLGRLLEKREIRLTAEGESLVEVSRIFNWRTKKEELILEESHAISEVLPTYHALSWSYECLSPLTSPLSEQVFQGARYFLAQLDPFQRLAKPALSQLDAYLEAQVGTLPLLLEYENAQQKFFLYLDRKTYPIGAGGFQFSLGILA